MRVSMIVLLLTSLIPVGVIGDDIPVVPDQTSAKVRDLLDTALSQVDMTSVDLGFDEDEVAIWGGDRWRLKYFSLFHRNPLKLPDHGKLNLESFGSNCTNITALVTKASRLIDHPVYRGLISDQLQDYLVYPDSIPKPSITRSKNIMVNSRYDGLRDRIDLIYRIADDDDFFFRKGIRKIDKDKYRQRLYEFFINENEEHLDLIYELADKVDFARVTAGAQDIAEAVRRMADSTEALVFPDRKIEFKTRKGLIVIGTEKSDLYRYLNPPLIIIDGGGDDTYEFSGYPDGYPLAIIVDLGGDDRYLSTDTTKPGIGGAVIGTSVLIDKSGNDYYETVNLALGSGLFGIGVLADHSGNDIYVSRGYSQGAGLFGVGILADSSGNDSLHCVSTSQGFGYTKGCGLLINYEGDDKYVADDSNIVNPSSQTAEHNSSLAQGVGFGRRADYVDGHSWAGGVGILCDTRGDDEYSAGLFAQGCGYWYAVGMLLDGGGDDIYRGVWYVQGSGAHFAAGYLDDFAGNDNYRASHNMALGAGHDFTVGFFNERGGDDTYEAPNLSLGAGNANGIGVFADHWGNDTYSTKGGITLGRANSSDKGTRRFLNVFGVFIDGGGNDAYDEPFAANQTRWIGLKSNQDNPSPHEIGVGIDW